MHYSEERLTRRNPKRRTHTIKLSAFVNCLASNKSFKGRLSRNIRRVIDILPDPNCEVIRPIRVDYNLIEVNATPAGPSKKRAFYKVPFHEKKTGLVTARAF